MSGRATFAQESASAVQPQPAVVLELQSIAGDAWTDAIETWKRLLPKRMAEIDDARLNFVEKIAPRHCYGLYAGAGPVYCSGNNTVFVGIEEMQRLTGTFAPLGDVGLSLLIGHEIGHHIQRIHGRFELLSTYVRRAPERQQEWIKRFELEADCLVGIWIRESHSFGVMPQRRIEIVASLRLMGDDMLQQSGVLNAPPELHLHGTSAQRVAAFRRGLEIGKLEVCDEFDGASFE